MPIPTEPSPFLSCFLEPPRRRPGWPGLLVTLLPALFAYAFLVWRFDFVCDDAYISFRYARNWADGHGLRYNLGSGPPVEGYSDFLWVAWAAVLERLSLATTIWIRVTSIACGVALVVWTTALARSRYALGPAGTAATALVVATLPPLVVWSTGGLATVPTTLAIFGAFALLLGRRERPRGVTAGLCGLAASLLRADGLAWVLLVLLAGFVMARSRHDRRLLRSTLIAAAIVVAGTVAQVLWRHGYYGDWLPNTARIKAGFSMLRAGRGLDYLMSLVLTMPSVALVTGLGLVAIVRRRDAIGNVALAVVIATTGCAVYVGGDFMAMGRFVVPMMPFVALLFAASWGALVGGRRAILGGGLAAVVVGLSLLPCFDLHLVPRPVLERFHFRLSNPQHQTEYETWRQMKQKTVKWTAEGKLLAATTRPGESIILGPIGAIGYYSNLQIHDTYGLTSRAVALKDRPPRRSSPGHDREVPAEFFFQFKPDYLGFALAPKGTPRRPGLLPKWSKHRDILRIEAHPVPEGLGFDPGKELWLLRLEL